MTGTNQILIEAHGASPESTPEQRAAIGKAVLTAVGAGGPLSPREMERFLAIATAYGAEAEAIGEWKRFDPASARLSDHFPGGARLGRHLAYEALRVCRAEGDPKRARARATEAARLLGVHAGFVASLLGIIESEEALQKARAAIEASGKGRAGGAPEAALAGLREITEKEFTLRHARLSLMDEDKLPRG